MSRPKWQERQQHTEGLIQAALAAVEPGRAVQENLRIERDQLQVGQHTIALEPDGRVFVVGAGKAGLAMAQACQTILGDRLYQGVMAVPEPPEGSGSIRWIKGGHPVPTRGSIEAGQAIADCLKAAGPEDLVLALISGGGSALMELPAVGVSLADLQKTTELLLHCGATIHEINSLRHQLSQIKGGGLARLAAPAQVVSLILSDVVGDRLDIIASGPTVPTASTAEAALAVIDRYQLREELPKAVLIQIQAAVKASPPETPPTLNVIIGSNRLAANALVAQAESLGFNSILLTNYLEGEAAQAGIFIAALAKSVRDQGDPLPAPACLVLGGETTVKVIGSGRGGRNQELALAAALELDGWDQCAVVALATDGVDGPTASAGGVITGGTIEQGRQLGLDPQEHLDDNDSHTFLAAVESDLRLGPTGTNVNDLAIVLVY